MAYTVGDIGIEFSAQLINKDNPYNPYPQSLNGTSRVYVIFYRPDGTRFEKDAVKRTLDGHAGQYISYTNGTAPSILDQHGDWAFRVAARFPNDILIQSPDQIRFPVVER